MMARHLVLGGHMSKRGGKSKRAAVSKRRWKDLSPGVRRLILCGAAVEGVLKVAVLVDLKRRPASEINGSKAKWAAAMLLNTAGILPMAYFLRGRRRAHGASSEP